LPCKNGYQISQTIQANHDGPVAVVVLTHENQRHAAVALLFIGCICLSLKQEVERSNSGTPFDLKVQALNASQVR
jgi:hypothetical protein